MIYYETRSKIYILKGDEDMIDHIKCINELKCLYWTKGRKRFAIGDICYLYLTNGGYNQICYKLKVANTSTSRKDEKFWKVPFFPRSRLYQTDTYIFNV